MRFLIICLAVFISGCKSFGFLTAEEKAERRAQKLVDKTVSNPRAVQLVIERGLRSFPYTDSFAIRPGKIEITHRYETDTVYLDTGEKIIREKHFYNEKAVDTMSIWERAKLRFMQATMDSMDRRFQNEYNKILGELSLVKKQAKDKEDSLNATIEELKRTNRMLLITTGICVVVVLWPLLKRILSFFIGTGPATGVLGLIRKLLS